jgi:threonine aldolase
MKFIDLYSDTKTLPTEEMRRAMYEAEVGDDGHREDPTVNRLEELAAHKLGKEAALFTASGTMSNLTADLTYTNRGDEIILGSEAHHFWYEVGGASALGGVVMHIVPNDPYGRMNPADVEAAIRPESILFPPTALLCLENTHNRCGGAVLTVDYTTAMAQLAHQHNLKVYLDGARIFNAAIALGVPASELAKPADSVSFCLSKGLSAPVGSLLCGTKDFVDKARKYRRMLGGGMRQAGVIAAAGIVALEKMIDRLAEDHANAKRLAEGLANIPGIIVQPERVQTNIVLFDLPATITATRFMQQISARKTRFTIFGPCRIRAVTHRMISAEDIDEVLNWVALTMKELL